MKPTFNLIEKPWARVLQPGGEVEELGLREAFAQAANIRELADDSPLVNVAVLRLLLAILHAGAWRSDELSDKRTKWAQWWSTRTLPIGDIENYFETWKHRFDLFDETHPFMQTGGLEMSEASPLARLAFEENNTSGMFAFPENPVWESPSPAQATRLLLATQGFALGFGKSSKAKIKGKEIEPPYTADAPLLRGLTIWLTGANLLETLLLNLAPFDPEEYSDDAPSWELDAPHELRDKLVEKKRVTEPPRGVMDCCTWHARLIRLLPEIENGQIVVRSAYFTQGRSITDDGHFDPMKVYISSKKEGLFPLSLSANRAVWRDAEALFHQPDTGYPCRAVEWIGERVQSKTVERNHLYRLHAVGLATEPGKAGKFLLWRHDRMPAPVSLLNDPNGASRIHLATEDAEDMANQLYGRFKMVAQLFDAPDMDRPGAKDPNPEAVAKLIEAFDPRRTFWARLETPFHEYLRNLPNAFEAAIGEWRDRVEREAKECFNASRRALGTSPRALRTAAISDAFRTKATRAKRAAEQAMRAADSNTQGGD
jgi:CRISPR system Cascade subunit CasA